MSRDLQEAEPPRQSRSEGEGPVGRTPRWPRGHSLRGSEPRVWSVRNQGLSLRALVVVGL